MITDTLWERWLAPTYRRVVFALHSGRRESGPAVTAGAVLAAGGAAVAPAAAIDLVMGGGHPIALGLASLVMVVIGTPLCLYFRLPRRFSTEELYGSLVVGAAAMLAAGAGVHLATGAVDGWFDALLESTAGVSTTAASVIDDPSELSRGEHLFRAMLQWGSGAVGLVAVVRVFPRLGIGGLDPGGGVATRAASRLSPTTGGNLRRLFFLYALFTAFIAIGYLGAGMPIFEAANHGLTVASTGGWSTRAGSIGAFDSAAIEWVSIVAMATAGVSLPFVFRLLRTGEVAILWRAIEFRTYVAVVLGAWTVLFVAAEEWSLEGVRAAGFAATSAASTTGLLADAPSAFGGTGMALLVTVAAIGGMAASLTGGVRLARVLVVVNVMRRELRRQLHQNSVLQVWVGRSTVGDEVVARILGEMVLNIIVAAAGYLALATFGDDVFEAIGATLSLLATAGPAYGSTDPFSTLTALDRAGQVAAMVLMLLGRVSVLPVLAAVAVVSKPVRVRVRIVFSAVFGRRPA